VSLFGGGTDRPSYYEKYGSTIISFAITRYMYLVWNPRPTGGCRLSYGEIEELETLKNAKHTLVRAAAEKYGIEEPCTLTIISDVPKGTGLGSSSALTVCLCELVGQDTGAGLEFNALELEQSVSPNVGLQDFLPAVFGGFRVYQFGPKKYKIGWQLLDEQVDLINTHGLLLYTGIDRAAGTVLENWKDVDILHRIRKWAEGQAHLVHEWTPDSLGRALCETWKIKSSIPGVGSWKLFQHYGIAKDAGALGGKLCGAGGGGCWFFLVPPSERQAVIDATGLREIPFQVAEKGVEKLL